MYDWKTIDEKKAQLDKLRPFPQNTLKSLQEKIALEWTYNSNAIEGNTLTLKETKVVLEGITIGGKSVREHLEVINHNEAVQYLNELIKNKETLSEWQIKQIHSLVLKKIDQKNAGVYRTENVTIAGAEHTPPDYIHVPEEMKNLIKSYKEQWKSLHPVERAAFLHIDFVKIHPFVDGNGRTSRLIQNFELMKEGFPPIVIRKEKRLEYYNALDKAHTTGKSGDFIKLSAECLEYSLDLYLKTMKQSGLSGEIPACAGMTDKGGREGNNLPSRLRREAERTGQVGTTEQAGRKEQEENILRLVDLHKQWFSVQPLPEENNQALWQWIRLQFNHHSNSFEGNTLVYDETQLLLIHGRTVGDHTIREYEEMKAHNVAFKYMCELAKEKRLVREADIRDLNKICLKEPFYKKARTPDGQSTTKKIIPGQYKKQPNHVVTQTGEIFYFATPEETPAKMAELIKWTQDWLKKNKEEQHKTLVSFLAELHHRFILIHPFDDGNGRVVRLLLAYILIRLDFLPMVLNNREQYIKAIQFADAGNITHLENLFLDNIVAILEKGIYAKNNKIDLNEGKKGQKNDRGLIHSSPEMPKTLGSRFRGNDGGSKNDMGSEAGEGNRSDKRSGSDTGSKNKKGAETRIARPSFREDESSQIPALQLLQNMGWTYLEPEEALSFRKGSIRNVLLEDILEPQLRKINQIEYKGSTYQFKDVNISNAIHELKTIPFEGLIKTSEKVFDLLTLGKSYMEDIQGDRKSYDLKYIDWEQPENNVYHVTDEYNVETSLFDDSKRRPDIILFINGIPVVIIECKRPDIFDPIEEAISQHIRNQKNREIPQLFVFSQILMALCPSNINVNKNRCMYGTTGTERKFWYPWKEETQFKTKLENLVNTPLSKEKKEKLFASRYNYIRKYFDKLEKAPRQITDQDIMLHGLCHPERVLEFIKKFILYDAGTKKIARYQQYFSVKNTLKRITSLKSHEKRPDGVIWHTQGSGKSLSMVMLAKAIAMESKITEPKVILVTDRVNLDEQIYKTFQNCQIPLTQAKSGTNLVEILQSYKTTVIATTLFKFETVATSKGIVLDSNDIIVLVDEAHRTQYGAASAKVRKVFPNACFIAYTGTPLTKKEKNTMGKFGEIIGSPYTSRDALDDQAIVPLLYEGRLVPQEINQKILDKMFERITKDLSEEQKADLKQKYNRNNQLAKTDQRIFMIAADISSHFSRMWKGKGFKGQLATNSISSALKYKNYFDELGEISTKVIISRTDDRKEHESIQEDETDLQRYEQMIKENFGTHQSYEKEMIAKFDSAEEPDILIVVNKLLTGFDVPRNTVLYLDKDIKEHSLLQATARVNRIFPQKEFGYVIDYHGNLQGFLDAVAHYDDLAKKSQDIELDSFDREEVQSSIRRIEDKINKLSQYYADLIALFSSVQNKRDLSAYENSLFEKENREDFYEKFSQFGNCLHRALSSAEFITETPNTKIKEYKEELKFFCKLKNHIQKVYAESIDYRDYEPKIENLLNTYVQAAEVQTVVPLVDIYDSKFNSELEGKSDKSKALIILHRAKKYISDNMDKDRVFYERLSELLQNTLNEYQMKRINEVEFLRQATKLKDEALTRTGDNLPSSLEGKEEAKAFFGVLKRVIGKENDLSEKNINELADMSIKISQIIKEHRIVDWFKNMDIQNRIKNKIEDYIYEQKEKMDISIDFNSIDRIMEETIKTAKSHNL
ncbi:MAG: HsdR family type I site-specific deoxyribonuclease [Bdellovibrionales bacterium]|nr:HsdR family type I site-specific deoxyribonuclease [Bdellovibrionales bacterium]